METIADEDADFGRSRPNILVMFSIVAFGIGFGWLGVHSANKWEVATGLYIVGCKNLGMVPYVLYPELISCSDCVSDNPYFLDCRFSLVLRGVRPS